MVMADTGMSERVDPQEGCRVRALACGTGIRYRFVSLLHRRTFHTKQTLAGADDCRAREFDSSRPRR
jgi:hypothetical protein